MRVIERRKGGASTGAEELSIAKELQCNEVNSTEPQRTSQARKCATENGKGTARNRVESNSNGKAKLSTGLQRHGYAPKSKESQGKGKALKSKARNW